MKRWHKRTSTGQQWPVDGTFDMACCEEVEANIKHHKASDTSDRRIGKRQKEKEVLAWFTQEGTNYRQTIKELRKIVNAQTEEAKEKGELKTSETWQGPKPDPPPYPGEKNPSRVGQYPVNQAPDVREEVMKFTGELTGKMLLTRKSTGESEQGVQRPSQCYDDVRQELEGLSAPQEEPPQRKEEQVKVTENTRKKKKRGSCATDQESPRHGSTSDEDTGSETSDESGSCYTDEEDSEPAEDAEKAFEERLVHGKLRIESSGAAKRRRRKRMNELQQ